MRSFIRLALSTCVLFFFLFGFQTSFVSCTKSVAKTDTVIKTDTLVKIDTVSKDTAITIQLLASRQWELQYIHEVTDNDTVFYTRGGAYNVNFDPQRLTFNSNFTGAVIDISSTSHSITWSFTDPSNTALALIVSNQPSLPNQTYNWNNMTYRNDSLLIDQYSSYQNVNSQAEIIWVGVPGTGH